MDSVNEFQNAQRRILERYGVVAKSHFVASRCVQGDVHVLAAGKGPPVVMVPGFGDPAAMWTPLMARLDGFRLYAVDRPCFGLTGSAAYQSATIRDLAVTFLEDVLDALDLKQAVFVGNSIGSLWTFWLALDRPSRVAAMVHIGCPATMLGTSAPLPMRLISVRWLGRPIMALAPPSPRQVEGFARAVGGEDLSDKTELRDLLVAAQKLPGVPQALRAVVRSVIRFRGARPEVALTSAQLAKAQQTTLLVWGARDVFGGPEVGKRAARIAAAAELRVVTEGGHVPWIGHPNEVADAVLPFLRTHAVT